jgi:hypothetical protein
MIGSWLPAEETIELLLGRDGAQEVHAPGVTGFKNLLTAQSVRYLEAGGAVVDAHQNEGLALLEGLSSSVLEVQRSIHRGGPLQHRHDLCLERGLRTRDGVYESQNHREQGHGDQEDKEVAYDLRNGIFA